MSIVGSAQSALEELTALLTPFAGDLAAALAIVGCTLAVRLLISPLTYLQVRGERRRAALAPEIERLREKHRDDPLALATETLALQKPLRGLLPGLAQAPFLLLMYRVAMAGPAGALFGVPLSAHLVAGWPVFAVLLVLSAALAWWSSRRIESRLLAWLPWLSVAAVAWLPLAGALYLVTSTAWSAAETLVWRRKQTFLNR